MNKREQDCQRKKRFSSKKAATVEARFLTTLLAESERPSLDDGKLEEPRLTHIIVGIIISGQNTVEKVLTKMENCLSGRYDLDTVKSIAEREIKDIYITTRK